MLLACQEGHLKVVEVLLENNATVSNKNSHDQNSLDVAVENGHKSVLSIVLNDSVVLLLYCRDVAMAIIKSNQMISALRNKCMHAGKTITPMRRIINRMPGWPYCCLFDSFTNISVC